MRSREHLASGIAKDEHVGKEHDLCDAVFRFVLLHMLLMKPLDPAS